MKSSGCPLYFTFALDSTNSSTSFRQRYRRESEDEPKDEKENFIEKTKHKMEDLEHKAEDVVKPVAEKLHVEAW